ncbi:MAG: glutamyl-tRNA reductase [Syntrophobacter sp. DG_60]|nr:MAG: glutamyl-tRNA reductase [Syntrophobacter sp. DG_60]
MRDKKIVLIGLNHKTAPIELRERLATSDNYEILRQVMQLPPVKEALFLSTCNRIEITITTEEEPEGAIKTIKNFLAQYNQIDLKDFENSIYTYLDADAVKHLFLVASSLDSMVIGEPQILGQIKEAYRLSLKQRVAGPILNRLLHKAFSVAKRVRTETELAHHAVSISYAAVELAKKIFGDLNGKHILLIGAGEMAELAVRHLLGSGVKDIVIANRTLERAVELSKEFNGRPISLTEISDYLAWTDIVVSSTGAPHFVIHYDHIKGVMRQRKNRPIFFIDIAVPRDIDPKLNDLDNVYLYNIDDLQDIIEIHKHVRQKEARKAERIVEEEVIRFKWWLETLEAVPIIVLLKKKLEEIRQKELSKTLKNLKHLSEEDKEAIKVMTNAMVKKILHDPITFLKKGEKRPKVDLYLDLARKLFNLDEISQEEDYHK